MISRELAINLGITLVFSIGLFVYFNSKVNKVENKIVIQKQAIENINEELEIEHKGNLITLEDGNEVIFIPTTGICYSHTMRPEKLGILSEDNKRIIKDY